MLALRAGGGDGWEGTPLSVEIKLTAEQVKESFLNEARLSMVLLEAEARIAELESDVYVDSAGKGWTWKAWAEHVESLLVHRQVVHDIDPNCAECADIIAILESAALGEAGDER